MKRHPLENYKFSYGLNNQQLAQAFNVVPSTVTRWLKDESSPTQRDIFELSKSHSLSQAMELAHQFIKWYEAQRNERKS